MPHSSSPNIPHTDSGGVFWFDQPAPANGKKNDQGKARYDLLPWKAVTQVVAVLEFGAYVKNYGPDNWRQVKEWRRRYFSAACRHLISWTLGEQLDAESGLPHLAHAACCVLFMLELDV
jgi:hypothetical protein